MLNALNSFSFLLIMKLNSFWDDDDDKKGDEKYPTGEGGGEISNWENQKETKNPIKTFHKPIST